MSGFERLSATTLAECSGTLVYKLPMSFLIEKVTSEIWKSEIESDILPSLTVLGHKNPCSYCNY